MSHASNDLPSGFQLTAFDPVYRNTPEVYLRRLRDEAPVHHDREFSSYVVTRAADVAAVLKDRTMCKDPEKSAPDSQMRLIVNEEPGNRSMLFLDDPDHRRLRSLVTQAFTARSINQIKPHIAEVAEQLLAEVEDREEFDIIADFASPLPMIIIAEMLGVDKADRANFVRWSRAADNSFNPAPTEDQRAELDAAFSQLSDYFHAVIAERREHPGDDLISAMVAAADGEDRLTDKEICTMSRLLLIAGNVTTTDLIGNAVKLLLDNPAEAAKLAEDAALADNLVEEVLRFDPPVMNVARIPSADLTMHDVEVKQGSTIMVSLVGAARDPALNDEPQRFDVARDHPKHFAFGGGAHFCLGAQLARAEAAIAIPMLFRKFPRLALVKEPERKIAPGFNGFAEIIVRPS